MCAVQCAPAAERLRTCRVSILDDVCTFIGCGCIAFLFHHGLGGLGPVPNWSLPTTTSLPSVTPDQGTLAAEEVTSNEGRRV